MHMDSPVNSHSSPAAKIAMFRSLFRGREDIYPRRFESRRTGTSGYQPACANEWARGLCDKRVVKCAECPSMPIAWLPRTYVIPYSAFARTSICDRASCLLLASREPAHNSLASTAISSQVDCIAPSGSTRGNSFKARTLQMCRSGPMVGIRC